MEALNSNLSILIANKIDPKPKICLFTIEEIGCASEMEYEGFYLLPYLATCCFCPHL